MKGIKEFLLNKHFNSSYINFKTEQTSNLNKEKIVRIH